MVEFVGIGTAPINATGKSKCTYVADKDTIYKHKEKYCVKCKYVMGGTKARHSMDLVNCDYLGMTGHRRNCSPIDCEKFEPATEKKKRKTVSLRRRK